MTNETNIESATTLEALRPGTPVTGTVTRLILSGAMVDIGVGQDALLHISQLGKTDFRNIEEVVTHGQHIETYVLKVNRENARVALTMVKPPSLPWQDISVGNTYQGTVVRIERFGAFVDVGAERPGMVHISEMADGYIQSPDDVVRVGDVVEVRVIKFNRKKRQIDLSMKEDSVHEVTVQDNAEDLPTAMQLALRRAEAMQSNDRDKRLAADKRNRGGNDQDEIFKLTLRSHGK